MQVPCFVIKRDTWTKSSCISSPRELYQALHQTLILILFLIRKCMNPSLHPVCRNMLRNWPSMKRCSYQTGRTKVTSCVSRLIGATLLRQTQVNTIHLLMIALLAVNVVAQWVLELFKHKDVHSCKHSIVFMYTSTFNVSPNDCIISCECCGTVTIRTQVFIRCPFMQYVYLAKHSIVFMYTSMCVYMWCIFDQKTPVVYLAGHKLFPKPAVFP